jgi:ankyrin repeat protein
MKTPNGILVAVTMLAWSGVAFCGEIHEAVQGGDVEKVKALLKANPEFANAKENNDWTPLHAAAQRGHKKIVEILLANKADVNARTKNGTPPLSCAVENGSKEVVELLLAKKADVNAKDNYSGMWPLQTAAYLARPELVELLLAHGADVNAGKDSGSTPLLCVCPRHHYSSTGAFTTKSNRLEVVKILMAHKADISVKDRDGWTALHGAVWRGDKEIAELLLSDKAEIEAKIDKNSFQGSTPLGLAMIFEQKDVAELLIAKGANMSGLLSWAINLGRKDLADFLRQHGAKE